MAEMSKHRVDVQKQTEDQTTARKRMALFPEGAEALFVHKDLWVVCLLRAFPKSEEWLRISESL